MGVGNSIRAFALLASGAVLLATGVVVVNQSAQLVQLATAIDPGLGTITAVGLVGGFGVFLGVPALIFLRLPRPLVPPADESSPEFPAHLRRLGGRLAENRALAPGADPGDRLAIEAALGALDARAEAIAREAAAAVFLSTAVSQSGRLDALLVLAAQSRMVWRIAHLYRQRPGARELAHLYANVAGTALLAGEVQDVDLAAQVEPILSSLVGGLGANVPGLHVAGTILTNSVLGGGANAFLTLRVGMVAKRYCGALVLPPRSLLRRAATAEAARLLGPIVAEGAARLSKAFWRASAAKVGDAVSGARDVGSKLLARVKAPWGSPAADPG